MFSVKLHFVSYASFLGLGGLLLGFLCRRRISCIIWQFRTRRMIKKNKYIYMISEHHQWEEIADMFCRKAKSINAIGFDCEWIQVKGKRRPVALMQLSTYCGLCALIRLNILKSNNIPISLINLLEDDKIAKVGVSPDMDAQYLFQDYNIMVNGWLDLRHLAIADAQATCAPAEATKGKLGLEALALQYLGRKLNKDWRVRSGDWESSTLANIQINYAAEDALVGIQVLLCLLTKLWKSPPSCLFLRLNAWEVITSKAVHDVCRSIKNVKFGHKSQVPTLKNRDGLSIPPAKHLKELRMSYSIRKSPLYHNSQLWAPDGEPLCTCDPKKAIWYVEKGLGELVSESPLVVKLKFEPAGRPNKEGFDGQFYLQDRYNLCVVCGKEESYIRKNVVPHEYRKFFPNILKSHQSHDVLLLCTECHQLSNIRDNSLRYTLAREFEAPIGCDTDVKMRVDVNQRAIRSAGGALKKSRHQLPSTRVQQLENILKKYFQAESISEEHINLAADLNIQIMNDNYTPHGYKVFKHFRSVGLIKLEERWRRWFLDSMKPTYMPEKWSISHNHKKLRMKMSRYPLDAAVREDYKIALVGSDGFIDVPYLPKTNTMGSNSSISLDETSQGSNQRDFSAGSTPEELSNENSSEEFSKENTPQDLNNKNLSEELGEENFTE